jgi:hypothetical protein
MRLLSLLLVLFFCLPPAAYAAEGIAEINQTCAVQTGCFAGDSPGFPVTIDGSAGGSYRLTSDLSVADPSLLFARARSAFGSRGRTCPTRVTINRRSNEGGFEPR